MTIFETSSPDSAPAPSIVWKTLGSNLWVATADGEYAGMVEFVDGHFTVRGSIGTVVAECSSIPAAKSALALHLEQPLAVAAFPTSLDTPRSFLSRAARPGYQRQSQRAA